MTTDTRQWLIWSNEHEAWWRPNSHGYVIDREEAGRYSTAEAREICERAGATIGTRGWPIPAELMVPADSGAME